MKLAATAVSAAALLAGMSPAEAQQRIKFEY